MSNKCLYCYKDLNTEGDFHTSCSLSFFGSPKPPALNYTIDEMAELARQVVENSITVPGVQPKLSLSFIKDVLKDETNGRLTVLGAMGGNYILKPQNKVYPQMPENEHLSMRMAELCGISVVPSSLIRLKSGELSYITKRIDRTQTGQKIHMLDMFQILEAFDKYKSSVEKIGRALAKHSANTVLDLLRLFEIVVFSYLTGNNDMHLKNFSMILKNEEWNLSPAYDLLNVNLHLPEDNEEFALTINGKKRKLTKSDFVNLGLKLQLTEKQISNTFDRFIKAENIMKQEISNSFLSTENQMKYIDLLEVRLSLFKEK
ncbi:MAG: HipA domain-containing protein [Bacteroidota bacterium]|jgi:serine/threonine-protein kinase HipA|nr:HipA domain-containing protein [Bacteroidales bacterium]MDI9535726.1 HipA domain-containing protein [Bacteroidota bacterium]OQC44069.1 MAG: putative DNA-binding transcriptional regulator [Bacteroidetes bacterium ADurb.Bin028]NLP21059.1 HipA domain-containing protein [Bacteroidales bacterium]HNY44060.1 HipA domain-containing protein [Bacteroidales bacterium]